jgi:hypothetical protein
VIKFGLSGDTGNRNLHTVWIYRPIVGPKKANRLPEKGIRLKKPLYTSPMILSELRMKKGEKAVKPSLFDPSPK